jgi:hypothetical protein
MAQNYMDLRQALAENLRKKKGQEGAPPPQPTLDLSDGQKMAAANQGLQLLSQAQGGEGASPMSGAASGAATGFSLGGPKGALIGAGAGALAGVMGARANRKAREREAKAQMLRNIGTIEQNKGISQSQVLGQLMAGLGSRR